MFFAIQLFLFLIFIVCFIVDIAAIAENPNGFDIADNKQLVPRIICMFMIFFLSFYEVLDFMLNWRTYFKRLWNFNDIVLFAMYIAYIAICYSQPSWAQALKVLQIVIAISAFFRLS